MKVSDFIIDFLVKEKVSHIFEVCGGALAHLLDSLHGRKDIATVSVHHEQAAAMAAEGYARITGDVGVAMATSGPGATNMLTGIASCFFDSIPSVFITGQVNTYEFKFNRPVRQIGFQETDIVSIAKPIVKDAILISDPSKIKYYLERAFYLARSGRSGPVLLDIPMNIQRSEIKPGSLLSFVPPTARKKEKSCDQRTIELVVRKLRSAVRPLILVGGGVALSGAREELERFASKSGIPVVSSLMGLDALSSESGLFSGMIGTYGNRYANLAVASADLLICLGTRLDTRQTGTNPKTFARHAVKIHVDIDPNELNNKLKVDFPIQSDIKKFLRDLNEQSGLFNSERISPWRDKIKGFHDKFPSFVHAADKPIHPNYLIDCLSGFLTPKSIVCADIGQNQIWAAQSLALKKGSRFLTQGGMGTMGSSLPMAIGASFAAERRPVVVIAGDGGFQLNIQELQTLFHHRLPVKVILLNNFCYGMVRQFQEQYFHSRFQSTMVGYSCPDFVKVAAAYKIPALRIEKNTQINKALKSLFAANGPFFLEIKIPQKTQVLPKLSVNKPIEDQEPVLTRKVLRSLLSEDR